MFRFCDLCFVDVRDVQDVEAETNCGISVFVDGLVVAVVVVAVSVDNTVNEVAETNCGISVFVDGLVVAVVVVAVSVDNTENEVAETDCGISAFVDGCEIHTSFSLGKWVDSLKLRLDRKFFATCSTRKFLSGGCADGGWL